MCGGAGIEVGGGVWRWWWWCVCVCVCVGGGVCVYVCVVCGGDSGGCGSGCRGGGNQLLHESIFALSVKLRHVQ